MFVDLVSRTFKIPLYKTKVLFVLVGLGLITWGLWNFLRSDLAKVIALVLGVYFFYEGF